MKHAMLVSCTRDPLGRIGATRRVAGTLIVVAAITLAGCGASGRQPDEGRSAARGHGGA